MKFKDLLVPDTIIEKSEDKEKRFVVTVELYMYDTDDKSVIKQAEKLAKDLQRKDDNQASITGIVEQQFGKMGNRKVK